MIRLKTIDAHAAGEPLRLIVDGFPAPHGKTMLEKRDWVKSRQDHLRRALMLEPRGHADMYGAVLTEPVSPGSHAGVLFMHNEGYSTMCGHGVIAVTTIALERGLIVPGSSSGRASDVSIVYAIEPGLRGIYGTIFTGPPNDARADLRNVTIFADAEVDRSPCGTGTAAVMAIIDAMGLLAEDRPFVHESLIGTRFNGRLAGRTVVAEQP